MEIGYFNTKTKEYEKEKIEGDFELLSLMGNLTRPQGSPLAHLHVVLSGPDHKAIGGHLIYGEIAVTGEILIQVFEGEIDREESSDLGFSPMSLRHYLDKFLGLDLG